MSSHPILPFHCSSHLFPALSSPKPTAPPPTISETALRVPRSILADEEAKEARARKLSENRALALAAKRETHDALSQLQAEEEHRMEEARYLVKDVQAARERPVQAMEELARQNRLKAQELREETGRLEAYHGGGRIGEYEQGELGSATAALLGYERDPRFQQRGCFKYNAT